MPRKPQLKVEVTNLDEVISQLRALPDRIRTAGERAVAEETEEVAQDMRDGAPYATGELVESIQAETDGLEGRAVATARHAFAVEFGTSRQPAQPFAQPAAERSRDRFPGRLADAVREDLA